VQPASRYPYIQQLRELFLAPYAVQSIPPSLKLHPNTSDKRNRQAQVSTWPGPLKQTSNKDYRAKGNAVSKECSLLRSVGYLTAVMVRKQRRALSVVIS
jgi:hypothetical protein